MTIADLIVRLEKTTPDRDLDLEIGEAVGAANHSGPASHRPFRDWAKHYTTSIDAALTLVPEGHKWSVACGRLVQYVARVTPTKSDHGYSDGECDSTPAIALCIAALRARAAVTASERGDKP